MVFLKNQRKKSLRKCQAIGGIILRLIPKSQDYKAEVTHAYDDFDSDLCVEEEKDERIKKRNGNLAGISQLYAVFAESMNQSRSSR